MNDDPRPAPSGNPAANPPLVAAVDWLLAGYNVLMGILWATVLGSAPNARWFILAHLAGAALPWVLSRSGRWGKPALVFRHAYPVLAVLPFWAEVDKLRRALHVTANDGVIKAIDTALFGPALHANWMPEMPWLWLSEPLHFAYFTYYVAVILPLILLALQKRERQLQEANFRIMFSFLACFTSFAFFPVDGPALLETMWVGPPAEGFFYQLVHAVNDRGHALGAAFPSSHAAGVVTVAFIGWAYLSRRWAWVLTALATGVVIATVYTQYHYAIDAVAGTLLAVVLQAWVAPLILRRGHRSPAISVPEPAPEPRLGWVRARGES